MNGGTRRPSVGEVRYFGASTSDTARSRAAQVQVAQAQAAWAIATAQRQGGPQGGQGAHGNADDRSGNATSNFIDWVNSCV